MVPIKAFVTSFFSIITVYFAGSTFVIDSLQPSQVGNYTCTVTNQYGSASKTFVIQSEGEFFIY